MKKIIICLLCIISMLFTFSSMNKNTSFLLFQGGRDNNNHGWEVKRNSNHTVPEIPDCAKEILDKYNVVYTGDNSKKTIYLTIDLGYENGNTEAVLNVLKKYNVKATFFIVKYYLDKNSDIVDRIVREGHMLGNHTANYRHLYSLSDLNIKSEINDMHNLIKDRYGISMKYMRPPYEEWSNRVLSITQDTGYKAVFWSIACVDWVKDAGAQYIYNEVMKNYHNGGILLLHTVSDESPAAFDLVIRDLKKKGYEIKPLDM